MQSTPLKSLDARRVANVADPSLWYVHRAASSVRRYTASITHDLALEDRLHAAVRTRYRVPEDLRPPLQDEHLIEEETLVGVPLPDDVRRFCTQCASVAPCPYTPVSEPHPFEIQLDQGGGNHDLASVLWDFCNPASHARLRRPFQLIRRWTTMICRADVSGLLPTQARLDAFVTDRSFAGLAPGTTPFDGWLDLWSELQYCDVWCIRYGVILHGPARGQVWASSIVCTTTEDTWSLVMKPLAVSFTSWYAAWLEL